MHRALRTPITAAVLLASAALARPAWAQVCTPDGFIVVVPKHYSVQKIEVMQVADPPVRLTLWTDRLGPRTTDDTTTSLRKDDWSPVLIDNPAGLQVNDDKPWRLGFDVLYAESGGDFSKPFECVAQELHASGPDPWGWYVLKFIPHELDPGAVGVKVRVILHRGPIAQPKAQKTP